MTHFSKLLAVALFISLLSIGAFAAAKGIAESGQEAVGQSDGQESNPASTPQAGMVQFMVTVLDKNGNPVTDLSKEEFHIFEGKQEQQLIQFERGPSGPMVVGLLIDVSRSRAGRELAGVERKYSEGFFRASLRHGDSGFVSTCQEGRPRVIGNLTADPQELAAEVNQVWTSPPRGGTPLYDAIYWLSRGLFARLTANTRVLVIISDAEDNESQQTREEAIEAALRAEVMLCFLYVGPDSSRGSGVARRLASKTGGITIPVYSEDRMERAFGQVSGILHEQYTLGFAPKAASKKDDEFRKLRVETIRKGLKALARSGYYPPKK
jgi:Ca-activated chloride channel family protein